MEAWFLVDSPYHQCHYTQLPLYEDSKVVTSSYSWSLSFVGHRWYRTAFIQAKNWHYKRNVLTSMHFTITNSHLVLFGCSKFCPYIQNCPYNHGLYKGVSIPVVVIHFPRGPTIVDSAHWQSCCILRNEPSSRQKSLNPPTDPKWTWSLPGD